MTYATSPIPSGQRYAPSAKFRGRGAAGALRSKDYRVQFSHNEWRSRAMPRMVDALCAKMFQGKDGRIYETRRQFCDEFADLVIDQRKVRNRERRVRDLDEVLSAAEKAGRVVVRNAGRGRVGVVLSHSEWEVQRNLAEMDEAAHDRKWRARRGRKGGLRLVS